jgi:hypothetical protein
MYVSSYLVLRRGQKGGTLNAFGGLRPLSPCIGYGALLLSTKWGSSADTTQGILGCVKTIIPCTHCRGRGKGEGEGKLSTHTTSD